MANKVQSKLAWYKQKVEKLGRGLNVKLDAEYNKIRASMCANNTTQYAHDENHTMKSACDAIKASTETTLLRETEVYKSLLTKLTNIKRERAERLVSLKSKEREMCHYLNEQSMVIHNMSMIDESDLKALDERVKGLNNEKNTRIASLHVIWSDVAQVVEEYQLSLDARSSLNYLNVLSKFDTEENAIENSMTILDKVSICQEKMEAYRQSLDKVNTFVCYKCDSKQKHHFLSNDKRFLSQINTPNL